jgi:D-apionolactonase
MTWSTEHLTWRSGPWSLHLRGDEFADIAFDGKTVLRSVRAVVRDRNWDTAPLVVDRVRDSGATLSLHVRSDGLGSSFRGVVRVEARHTRLVVIADLESEQEFATNRTGLVVLHPPRLAGEALRVTHTDGTVEESSFPVAISPHQPVLDIAELSWLHAGSEVSVGFEGDVFEMEDQRNWSDASYKTYSRPLAIPFPYAIAAGERVQQTVRIDVRDVATPVVPGDVDVVRLEVGGPVFEIGLGAATAADPTPARAEWAPAAVLVELDLRTPNWRAALARAVTVGTPLDVRVVASASAPFDEVAAALSPVAETPGIVRVGVFEADLHVTDAAVLGALSAALEAEGLRPPVVAGSRAHFTELNREWHIIPRQVEGIAFSTTPLFHSVGTEQLIESVAVQRTIARQAVRLADGLPVHIGPVTLRPRYNDVATTPPPTPTREDLSEGYGAQFTGAADPRQQAVELAAWTIASAAALAVPGVASIAYFEEWGDRGIHSSSGEPFPVATALEELRGLGSPGAHLLWGDSPDGLVWVVGARGDDSDVVLVANLDGVRRELTIELGVKTVTVGVEPLSFGRIALDH